jgi:hypothetical protein
MMQMVRRFRHGLKNVATDCGNNVVVDSEISNDMYKLDGTFPDCGPLAEGSAAKLIRPANCVYCVCVLCTLPSPLPAGWPVISVSS